MEVNRMMHKNHKGKMVGEKEMGMKPMMTEPEMRSMMSKMEGMMGMMKKKLGRKK